MTPTEPLLSVSPACPQCPGTDGEMVHGGHSRRIHKVCFAKMRRIPLPEIAETCSL